MKDVIGYQQVSSPEEIDALQWEARDGVLNLMVQDIKSGTRLHIWLSDRPHYCDRGHIQANIDTVRLGADCSNEYGMSLLDSSDAFPRYFHSVDRALNEAMDFLHWRLYKHRRNGRTVGQYIRDLTNGKEKN